MSTQTVNGIEVSDEDPSEIFDVLAKLGEGSYGSVFKALDKRDNKIVAIKVLEVENEDTADLRKEINFLKGCSSEFIVAYKGSFVKDNQIWIVMEYCGAGSLCDLMAICERTLTEEQIASVMKMSLMGLKYLHENKKIHRDIKSGNILLTHSGECKLADFGVSAELTNTMSKRKTVIGTPYWMAPEVLQSAEYDGKADIWSLAITAIELAVGEPPHSNVHPMRAIFMIPTSEPPTLPEPDDWSPDFNNFLKVCLQKEAAKRPTAAQLLTTHPFCLKAKGKATIAALVEECMQEIDDYREQEAKEAEEKEANGEGDAPAGTDANNGGTIVPNKNKTGGADAAGADEAEAGAGDSGTMLFSAGGTKSEPDFGAGTMVFNKKEGDSKSKPQLPIGGKDKKSSKKEENFASQTGTMLKSKPSIPITKAAEPAKAAAAAATPSSSTPLSPTSADGLANFYKTGKNLEVTDKSSLVDLRKSLIALNKAQERELTELEQYYSEKRKLLLGLIEKKEKTEGKKKP